MVVQSTQSQSNNEELKDVLTAISVVAKRIRDKVDTKPEEAKSHLEELKEKLDAGESLNNEQSVDIDVESKIIKLIDCYNILGEYRKISTRKIYETPGVPENKDKILGYQRASCWYTDMRKDIIDVLSLLQPENNSERTTIMAEDIIEAVDREQKDFKEKMYAEIFGNNIETKKPAKATENISIDPMYEAVKRSSLLGEDGTLQLDKYDEMNVQYSWGFNVTEGALQSDHNKMVEIYEILSSLSPCAYKFGKLSRAEVLRKMADDIEIAETLK